VVTPLSAKTGNGDIKKYIIPSVNVVNTIIFEFFFILLILN